MTDVFVVFFALKYGSMVTYGCFMVLKVLPRLMLKSFSINGTNYSTHMFH